MHKLKLDLDMLAVESFVTARGDRADGTVRGAEFLPPAEPEPQPLDTGYTRCAQSACVTWERTCGACTGIECPREEEVEG